MTDPTLYVTLATAALAGLGMVTFATLAGWRGWLALKQQELAQTGDIDRAPALPNASARIEIADLKERIRKLEAIAAGVDL
ncbi:MULTISPECIES: hypothetical protein [Sphingomonas]|uniref:hypothetical protein n=1 Tax=Sphingomonas TaxID=13687 RepID=UPI000829C662|nr:hypothetical protein [Sphingomonas sp. CCH10-B3]MBA3880663.1 hypothetical protein [Sphingobium sp.]